ncbi:MAG: hypothetical protein QM493_09415 [Sulfurovum sp.]
MYLLESFHIISHGHFPLNWHFFVLLSGISLLLAGVTKKYLFIEGFEEEKNNFEEMLPIFEKASTLLQIDNNKITIKDRELLERVIFNLSKKSLILLILMGFE